MEEVKLIVGDHFKDARGSLSFVNAFDFSGITRFYSIHHPDTSVIRAWQGHKIEHKYFFTSRGSFLVAYVRIDNWDNPAVDLKVETVILSADKPSILSIPAGFANGLKALEENSTLISFSNLEIEAARADNWRFDSTLWFDWSKY